MQKHSAESEITEYFTVTKTPYRCSFTMSGCRVVDSGGEKYINKEEEVNLKLINKVYSDCLKFIKNTDVGTLLGQSIEGKHDTVKLRNIQEGIYKRFVEIDISRAYPTEAYRIGVISKETYKWLVSPSVPKKDGLSAIGSLATNKFQFEFDGSALSEVSSKRKKTAAVFFLISNNIYKLLLRLHNNCNKKIKNSSIGFWVDAIFVKEELKSEAIRYFSENGFECKISVLPSIKVIIKDHVKYIYMVERKDGDDTPNSCGVRVKSFIVPGFGLKARKERAKERILGKLNGYFGAS